MAAIRTLKLNLLADTKNFTTGLNKANKDSQKFSNDIGQSFKNAAKMASLAGVAVAGAAVAFGVDAVKAAMADQKSQVTLANALRNTTKATKAQIAQTEDWITKTQFATGVSDTKLRPALTRLTRSTKNVGKSQKLLNLALDIAAGTGKDVETVVNALSKGYDGNLTAIKRLGVPLDDSIIKSKNFSAAVEVLTDQFKGASKEGAQTLEGKLAILNQRFDEAKETIGTAIIDALQPLAEKWLPIISEGITAFVDGLTGRGNFNDQMSDAAKKAYEWGEKAKNAIKWVIDHKDALVNVGKVIAGLWVISKIATFITNIGYVVTAIRGLRVAFAEAAVAEATLNWKNAAAMTAAGLAMATLLGVSISGSLSKPADQNLTDPPQNTDPNLPGYTGGGGGGGAERGFLARGGTVININGIIDAESARRSIENIIQQSSIRTAPVNFVGRVI